MEEINENRHPTADDLVFWFVIVLVRVGLSCLATRRPDSASLSAAGSRDGIIFFFVSGDRRNFCFNRLHGHASMNTPRPLNITHHRPERLLLDDVERIYRGECRRRRRRAFVWFAAGVIAEFLYELLIRWIYSH